MIKDLSQLKNGKHWNAKPTIDKQGQPATGYYGKWINYLDESEEWQVIDTKFYDNGDNFKMDKGPFFFEAPKYADGIAKQIVNNGWDISSRTKINADPIDVTIRATGAAHIQGRLEVADIMFSEGKPATYVIYDNAFPEIGADLIYYIEHGVVPVLRKLIRFNTKPTLTEDARLDFEYGFDHTTIATMQWDPNPDKTREFMKFDYSKIEKHTHFKGFALENKLDDKRGMALRSYRIWDSSKEHGKTRAIRLGVEKDWKGSYWERINCDVKQLEPGKLLQTKIIPKAYFEKELVYPVYSDTTSTFFSASGTGGASVDGPMIYIEFTEASMATMAQAANASNVNPTTSLESVPQVVWNTDDHRLYRGIFTFDTSSIPAANEVSAATLSFHVLSKADTDTTSLNVYGMNPASANDIVVGDYSTVKDTEFATTVTISSITTGGYNDFTLNSTGRAAIAKSGIVIENPPNVAGITVFSTRISLDLSETDATGGNGVTVYLADDAGDSRSPVLVVIHASVPIEVNVNDSITVAENTVMLLTSFIDVNDSITVAEDVEIGMVSVINVNDSIALSESVTVENPTLPLEVNDSITVAESVTMLITFLLIDINDTISVAENVIMEQFNLIDVNDSISVAESTTLFIPFFAVTVNDSISVAENVSIIRISEINVNDSITVADVPTIAAIEININLSDSISVTEFIDLSKTIIWAGRTTITDSWTDRTSIFDEIWTKGHRDEDAKYTKE